MTPGSGSSTPQRRAGMATEEARERDDEEGCFGTLLVECVKGGELARLRVEAVQLVLSEKG